MLAAYMVVHQNSVVITWGRGKYDVIIIPFFTFRYFLNSESNKYHNVKV